MIRISIFSLEDDTCTHIYLTAMAVHYISVAICIQLNNNKFDVLYEDVIMADLR